MFVRLRELTEAECYVRCYGDGDPHVRVLRVERRRTELRSLHVSGEELRRLFEVRLDARESEAA